MTSPRAVRRRGGVISDPPLGLVLAPPHAVNGHRDIVVVGASAGGIEALTTFLGSLPSDLEAAVLVVQHLSPQSTGQLVRLLGRHSALPVVWADQGMPIERGRVYLGPPDVHFLVERSRIALVAGAMENHARPSINRLFRSAAASYGSRVVGVLLTGMLDDGAAGLLAVRACGGVVIVQDPVDAAFPSMPRSALEAMTPDAVLPLREIPAEIVRRVAEPAQEVDVPPEVALEADLDRTGRVDVSAMRSLGPQATISCPECGGPTWAVGETSTRSYRCYLGHASSAHTMLATKGSEVDRAMWAAVRALEERGATYSRLASDAESFGSSATALRYRDQAQTAFGQVGQVRRFIEALHRERHHDEGR